MRRLNTLSVIAGLAVIGLSHSADAGEKKLKKPPAPLNKQVKYEAYPDTDIAMVSYLSSRKEFRVGHSPYKADRFYLAEFILITEHYRKYRRPDLKAEIKMAPARSKPELMANKVFQQKWKDQLAAYKKMISEFKKVKTPKICKAAHQAFLKPLEDEVLLAEKIAKLMFVSQQIRARERLREDLYNHFRAKNAEWYDRLFEDFEREADLSKFYPRFVDLFVDSQLTQAQNEAEEIMKKIGLEYATAVSDDKGVID